MASGSCTIILRDPYMRWFRSMSAGDNPAVYTRGYAFIGNDFFNGQDLVNEVCRRCTMRTIEASCIALKSLIPSLNGCWALVAEWPTGHVIAATDRLRSIPLFYASTKHGTTLSSSLLYLIEEIKNPEIDEISATEFLLAGFVTGFDTLYRNVRQMQGGEILEFCPNNSAAEIVTHRYYRFTYAPDSPVHGKCFEDKFASVLDGVFARYAKALSGQRLCIPLSGGLDSRLVAGMLRRHGIKDVLCYSYGPVGNQDALSSREVAAALAYDWEFVEYSPQAWARWLQEKRMHEYGEYHRHFGTVPHIQGFPAASTLIECGKAAGRIFVPGHSGDFLFGSHAARLFRKYSPANDMSSFLSFMIRSRYDLWPEAQARLAPAVRNAILDRIEAIASANAASTTKSGSDLCDMWLFENDQPKYAVNDVRIYEMYGHDWVLPLWDYELMDFATSVPEQLRWGEQLYLNTLTKKIFTGDLRTLGDIPTERRGSPREKATGRTMGLILWNIAQKAVDILGVRGAARRFMRRHCISEHPLQCETWLAGTADPRRVQCGEILRKHGVQEYIPASLWALPAPCLSMAVCEVAPKAILSAIALSEVYAGLFEAGHH